MSRDTGLYLADIETASEKVLRFTAGFTFKQFTQDDEKFDAVLRNLEIIGEAVKHILDHIRGQYPDIKWRKIQVFAISSRTIILGLAMRLFGMSYRMKFHPC